MSKRSRRDLLNDDADAVVPCDDNHRDKEDHPRSLKRRHLAPLEDSVRVGSEPSTRGGSAAILDAAASSDASSGDTRLSKRMDLIHARANSSVFLSVVLARVLTLKELCSVAGVCRRWKEASYNPQAIGNTLDLSPYALRMTTEVARRLVDTRLSGDAVKITHLNLQNCCQLDRACVSKLVEIGGRNLRTLKLGGCVGKLCASDGKDHHQGHHEYFKSSGTTFPKLTKAQEARQDRRFKKVEARRQAALCRKYKAMHAEEKRKRHALWGRPDPPKVVEGAPTSSPVPVTGGTVSDSNPIAMSPSTNSLPWFASTSPTSSMAVADTESKTEADMRTSNNSYSPPSTSNNNYGPVGTSAASVSSSSSSSANPVSGDTAGVSSPCESTMFWAAENTPSSRTASAASSSSSSAPGTSAPTANTSAPSVTSSPPSSTMWWTSVDNWWTSVESKTTRGNVAPVSGSSPFSRSRAVAVAVAMTDVESATNSHTASLSGTGSSSSSSSGAPATLAPAASTNSSFLASSPSSSIMASSPSSSIIASPPTSSSSLASSPSSSTMWWATAESNTDVPSSFAPTSGSSPFPRADAMADDSATNTSGSGATTNSPSSPGYAPMSDDIKPIAPAVTTLASPSLFASPPRRNFSSSSSSSFSGLAPHNASSSVTAGSSIATSCATARPSTLTPSSALTAGSSTTGYVHTPPYSRAARTGITPALRKMNMMSTSSCQPNVHTSRSRASAVQSPSSRTSAPTTGSSPPSTGGVSASAPSALTAPSASSALSALSASSALSALSASSSLTAPSASSALTTKSDDAKCDNAHSAMPSPLAASSVRSAEMSPEFEARMFGLHEIRRRRRLMPGDRIESFPSLIDIHEEDEDLKGPITDEKPIRVECHHEELSQPGYLRHLFEQYLVDPTTRKCSIEHLAWVPCYNMNALTPSKGDLMKIVKVSSATLRVLIVDYSQFDEEVLEYLSKKCPQLEGLSAGRNIPVSIQAIIEACGRCPNLNLAPTGRLLQISGNTPGAAELREAAPHLNGRDFMRVWNLVH